MAAIVPKKDAPGVDLCGTDQYYYIVRSDVGCYMRSTNFNKGEDLDIFSLHPACSNGDHYLAYDDDLFYIIKGTSFRCVSDIGTDEGAIVCSLHPSCQGGDHYFSAFGNFYIVYQNQGVYRRTKNMTTYKDGIEYSLHPDCKDALYYYGVKDCYYFVRPHEEWGVQYYRCTNFNTNESGQASSFHPSVTNFLPGGLGLTHGPSAGVWTRIQTIKNDSQNHTTWSNKVPVTQGFDKEKLSPIENHWNISASLPVETGLSALLTKSQFSLPPTYGGSNVNTDGENWKLTTIEETISVLLEPGKEAYVWQYQLSLGSNAVLFCRNLRFDDPNKPPVVIPLPPAKH